MPFRALLRPVVLPGADNLFVALVAIYDRRHSFQFINPLIRGASHCRLLHTLSLSFMFACSVVRRRVRTTPLDCALHPHTACSVRGQLMAKARGDGTDHARFSLIQAKSRGLTPTADGFSENETHTMPRAHSHDRASPGSWAQYSERMNAGAAQASLPISNSYVGPSTGQEAAGNGSIDVNVIVGLPSHGPQSGVIASFPLSGPTPPTPNRPHP